MEIFQLLGGTKVAELAVSLVSLAVLILVKELNARYSKKLPIPIPIELIVVSPCCVYIVTFSHSSTCLFHVTFLHFCIILWRHTEEQLQFWTYCVR